MINRIGIVVCCLLSTLLTIKAVAQAPPQDTASSQSAGFTSGSIGDSGVVFAASPVHAPHATAPYSIALEQNCYRMDCQHCNGACNSCQLAEKSLGPLAHFKHRVHKCDYCRPYCARPFGSAVRDTLDGQKSNGISAQLVFFDFHFSKSGADGNWTLTNAGQSHADTIARLIGNHYYQVLVEPTGDPRLDEVRRKLAFEALQYRGVAIGLEDVVARKSRMIGISGVEAQVFYSNRFQPMRILPNATPTGIIVPSSLYGGDQPTSQGR